MSSPLISDTFLWMKILLLVLLLSISPIVFSDAPSWFQGKEGQMGDCDNSELCFLGDGDSKEAALADARAEFSKYFETKIKSTSSFMHNYSSKGTVKQSSVDEWSIKSINEESESLAIGLAIKKIEEKNQKFYVLMGVNKKNYADTILDTINSLDSDNVKLLETKSRFGYPKIFSNLELMEKKKIAYNLLTNKKIDLKIEAITMKKLVSKLKKIKFYIKIDGEKEKNLTNGIFAEIFSPIKVVFVKGGSFDFILEKEITTKELFFNVKGFTKVQVELRLSLKERNEKALGKVFVTATEIGRTPLQAIEKALPKIKNDLVTNLYLLSMEIEGVKP